jgi:hypothetical protein
MMALARHATNYTCYHVYMQARLYAIIQRWELLMAYA